MPEKRPSSTLDRAIKSAIEQLTDEQREHYRNVCMAVLGCYVNQSTVGMLLIGDLRIEDALTDMISLGCGEMTAVKMLTAGQGAMGVWARIDEPPREMYS